MDAAVEEGVSLELSEGDGARWCSALLRTLVAGVGALLVVPTRQLSEVLVDELAAAGGSGAVAS